MRRSLHQDLRLLRADKVEQGDVVQHLVPIVPSVQCSVLRVVVQHRDMGILVLEWDVNILIGGGVGVEGVVDLRSSRVAVSHVESSTDHESLPSAPFRVVGGPALDDLQCHWVELADDDVPCILIGGIHSPKSTLVHHQVDVRMAAPGVVVAVVKASIVQLTGLTDGGRLEVKLNDGVTLELVEVNGAVVDHLAGARPRVRETMRGEVIRVHEVRHGLVLTDEAVVVVTIHVVHLITDNRVTLSAQNSQDSHKIYIAHVWKAVCNCTVVLVFTN